MKFSLLFSICSAGYFLPVSSGVWDLDDHYYKIEYDPYKQKLRKLQQLQKFLYGKEFDIVSRITKIPLRWSWNYQ